MAGTVGTVLIREVFQRYKVLYTSLWDSIGTVLILPFSIVALNNFWLEGNLICLCPMIEFNFTVNITAMHVVTSTDTSKGFRINSLVYATRHSRSPPMVYIYGCSAGIYCI